MERTVRLAGVVRSGELAWQIFQLYLAINSVEDRRRTADISCGRWQFYFLIWIGDASRSSTRLEQAAAQLEFQHRNHSGSYQDPSHSPTIFLQILSTLQHSKNFEIGITVGLVKILVKCQLFRHRNHSCSCRSHQNPNQSPIVFNCLLSGSHQGPSQSPTVFFVVVRGGTATQKTL